MTELTDIKSLLLDLVHESYDRVAWHGPNLTQALSGVDADQASWRPAANGAAIWNIREIVLHVTRIMQECGASLLVTGADRAQDVREDMFPLPDVTDDKEWRRNMDFLQQSFDLLCQGISEFAPARLNEASTSSAYNREWSVLNHIYGIAYHNVYHAAQIVSLRKRQHKWSEL